jgi:hypothetical protein
MPAHLGHYHGVLWCSASLQPGSPVSAGPSGISTADNRPMRRRPLQALPWPGLQAGEAGIGNGSLRARRSEDTAKGVNIGDHAAQAEAAREGGMGAAEVESLLARDADRDAANETVILYPCLPGTRSSNNFGKS